ncbi:MAG: hypothetical protein M3498_18170 [Deinococcota bacterium]|jgi:aspartate/methionine/tyrosine aminotransferase|nr:hypothetical protein [Deinococcota bacterium]
MSPNNPQTIDAAIAQLKDCREREEQKYGEQVKELGRLSSEAPAPDPCVDAFNRLVQEILDHGGSHDELDLGELREEIGRVMAVRRQAKNKGGRGG